MCYFSRNLFRLYPHIPLSSIGYRSLPCVVCACVRERARARARLSPFFLCECCFSAAALVAGGFWNVLLLTRMCLAL